MAEWQLAIHRVKNIIYTVDHEKKLPCQSGFPVFWGVSHHTPNEFRPWLSTACGNVVSVPVCGNQK